MRLKKIFSIVFVLLLVAMIHFSASAATDDQGTIIISDDQQLTSVYSVTPDDSQWAEFETYDEMVEACHIPDEKLEQMSSEELVMATLDYPLLVNLYLFNTIEEGIESIRQGSDAFNELLSRDDGASSLYEVFTSSLRNKSDLSLKQMSAALLLTDNVMLNSLPSAAQSNLIYQLEQMNMDVISSESSVSEISMNGGARTDEFSSQSSAAVVPGKSTVKTPNGTIVNVDVYLEGPDLLLSQFDKEIKSAYPNATYVSRSSLRYNCHSYAWYSQSTSNGYVLLNPSAYMTDGSYKRVTSSGYLDCIGYKLYYSTGNHSAIITGTAGPIVDAGLGKLTVKSKWGNGPVMEHKANYSPYYSDGLQVWKR